MEQGPSVSNLVSGVVRGNVVQVGTMVLTTDKELVDELHRAKLQLVISQRAEWRTGLLVSILYVALDRAFRLIGELTVERERAGSTGERRSVEGRLAEAHNTHDRTRHQLERAETERERAARLVATIGRKIMRLQGRLIEEAPAEAAGSALAEELEFSREDPFRSLNLGLDRIDQLLDAQDEELAQLDSELAGRARKLSRITRVVDPEPDKQAEAARLVKIASDSNISLKHRMAAAYRVVTMGQPYLGDVDVYLRLMISDPEITHPDKLASISRLASLGPRYEAEAVAMLRQIVDSDRYDLLDRVQAAAHLGPRGDAGREHALAFIKKVALSNSSDFARVIAVETWYKMCPDDKEQIISAARAAADHDGVLPFVRQRILTFIQDVLTDPRLDRPAG